MLGNRSWLTKIQSYEKITIPVVVLNLHFSCFYFLQKKGPAEKVGEKMDEAIENVQDAVNPEGPVEKVGEKIDNALGE